MALGLYAQKVFIVMEVLIVLATIIPLGFTSANVAVKLLLQNGEKKKGELKNLPCQKLEI